MRPSTFEAVFRALLPGLLEADDLRGRRVIGQHVHDFDPGTFHVMEEGVDPR